MRFTPLQIVLNICLIALGSFTLNKVSDVPWFAAIIISASATLIGWSIAKLIASL